MADNQFYVAYINSGLKKFDKKEDAVKHGRRELERYKGQYDSACVFVATDMITAPVPAYDVTPLTTVTA